MNSTRPFRFGVTVFTAQSRQEWVTKALISSLFLLLTLLASACQLIQPMTTQKEKTLSMEATNANHQATIGWFIAGSHPQDYAISIVIFTHFRGHEAKSRKPGVLASHLC